MIAISLVLLRKILASDYFSGENPHQHFSHHSHPNMSRQLQGYARPRTRQMTIIAQDPSFKIKGQILRASVEVPVEPLAPGPTGYRVQVVDYDSSTNKMYKPRPITRDEDPYGSVDSDRLINDPRFHQQNVYAIAMATLRRFEQALGRRVAWNFPGGSHQLKIVPHAFVDANAFYSPNDEAVFFGYFRGVLSKKPVFTCLSHNVIAHELTHALLDGLLPQYMRPRSPDQFAFHEGFADIVALFSVLSAFHGVIEFQLDQLSSSKSRPKDRLIASRLLTVEGLRSGFLIGLAMQVGAELSGVRGQPLREPALLHPGGKYLTSPEFMEPHRRGEVLVAAMLNAFLYMWSESMRALGQSRPGYLHSTRVVQAGREVAELLLLASIRALDYTPPVQVSFGDFLSGLITADAEVHPLDSKHRLGEAVLRAFAAYGITPASRGWSSVTGAWERVETYLSYDALHFDAMQFDQVEMFRFLWQNRHALGLSDTRTYVQSVRPVQRISKDGFVLRETVANYIQTLDLKASELKMFGVRSPLGMSPNQKLKLEGGGSLVFDSYGRLRYHVHNPVIGPRQEASLQYLWERGALERGLSLSALHRGRGDIGAAETKVNEQW